jgi:DNA-binding CsgD family transcriptional regulator
LLVDRQRELAGSARLTPREREILTLVGRGETSRTIASILCIAPSTVDALVGSAMGKLGARTRTHAAVLAAVGVVRPHDDTGAAPVLSDEERMLLAFVADGVAIAEAAQRLHISRRTAVRRLAHVRCVLQARSNREAVVLTRATHDAG